MAELVEAAARAGERGIAERALERLTLTTEHSGSEWALAVEADRSRCSATARRPITSTSRRSIDCGTPTGA